MLIEFHRTNLPTPDMAWLVQEDRLVLIADRRVPIQLVVDSVRLALAWADGRPPDEPSRAA